MTATDEKPYEFGLYVSLRKETYDRENPLRVTVQIVMKDDNDPESIVNCSDSRTARWDRRCPKRLHGLELQDLGMSGQVYHSKDTGNEWIAFEPRYRNVYSVELPQAERMVKTLKALQRANDKWWKANPDRRFDHGEQMAILAKLVGAKFVVVKDDTEPSRGWSYRDNKPWQFLPVWVGIEKYKAVVEQVCKAYKDPYARVA
jgi:hypothetical protein